MQFLRQDGWPCLAIHGDKAQNERDWVLNEFKTGKSPIMVATDVASRGIGMNHAYPPPLRLCLCNMMLFSRRLSDFLAYLILNPVSVGFPFRELMI